jgi:hypothetical protein
VAAAATLTDCTDVVRERLERGDEVFELDPDRGIVRVAPPSSHASIALSDSFFRRDQSSIVAAPLRVHKVGGPTCTDVKI